MVDPGLVAAQLGPFDVASSKVVHICADAMPSPTYCTAGNSLYMSNRRVEPQDAAARLLQNKAHAAGKAERDESSGPRRLLIAFQDTAAPQVAPRISHRSHGAVPTQEHPRRAHSAEPHKACQRLQHAKQLKSMYESPGRVQILVAPVVDDIVWEGDLPRPVPKNQSRL